MELPIHWFPSQSPAQPTDISTVSRRLALHCVKTGKAPCEHMFSALHPKSGHCATYSACPFRAAISGHSFGADLCASACGTSALSIHEEPVLDCLVTAISAAPSLQPCLSQPFDKAPTHRITQLGMPIYPGEARRRLKVFEVVQGGSRPRDVAVQRICCDR